MMAQLVQPPAATETAVLPVPSGTAGKPGPMSPSFEPRLNVSPRPSCPEPLYPQHWAFPVVPTAQVWR
jgi:hypothetical protein